MHIASALLFGTGLALLLFAGWGMGTASGGRAFDEMAGIIPFAAGVAGALLVLAAAVVAGLRLRSRGQAAARPPEDSAR